MVRKALLSVAIDGRFELEAGCEAWYAFRRHLHGAPVPRVADAAGFAVRNAECSETGERHPVSFHEAPLDPREECVQRARGLCSRQARICRDLYDHVFLIQEAPMPASNIKAATQCQPSRIDSAVYLP